jgi:hypothetical protein
MQVFGHNPELQPFAILFEDAGISGAALQGASHRDLDSMLKATGIGAAMSVLVKAEVQIWKQHPDDAIQRAAASKVRASGTAPACSAAHHLSPLSQSAVQDAYKGFGRVILVSCLLPVTRKFETVTQARIKLQND